MNEETISKIDALVDEAIKDFEDVDGGYTLDGINLHEQLHDLAKDAYLLSCEDVETEMCDYQEMMACSLKTIAHRLERITHLLDIAITDDGEIRVER